MEEVDIEVKDCLNRRSIRHFRRDEAMPKEQTPSTDGGVDTAVKTVQRRRRRRVRKRRNDGAKAKRGLRRKWRRRQKRWQRRRGRIQN